jgi:hypothetical protein
VISGLGSGQERPAYKTSKELISKKEISEKIFLLL